MPKRFDSSFHPRASRLYFVTIFAAGVSLAAIATASAVDTMANPAGAAGTVRYFMPDAAASKVVTVTSAATAAPLGIVILTQAVAVKETGPKPTINHFGEVYAFSPTFIAVHRDEPTQITLWNLQPDDDHDFMLEDRPNHVLMHQRLAPLSKTSYVYTFHREGLYDFRCAVHQPEMNGQILVLPPR